MLVFPYERFAAALERRHRAILRTSAALFALSAVSLAFLRLDMDVLAQIPSERGRFRDYTEYLRTFGARDHLFALVTGERGALVSFADAFAERLRAIPAVASVAGRLEPEAIRREWIEPRRFELLTAADYRVLADRLAPASIDERVRNLRSALAMPLAVAASRWIVEDPFGVNEILRASLERRYGDPRLRASGSHWLAPDGRALLLVIRPERSAFDTVFGERLMASVRGAEHELLDGPFAGRGLAVDYTGSAVYALGDRRAIRRDLAVYFVVAPLAVLLVFHATFRSLRLLPLVFYPLALATLLTFALSQLVVRNLNMISVAFAGIFWGLGIDSAIYFCALAREKAAMGPREVAAVLREIGPATVVASTTSAAVFAVIGFSDFTGVSQLGAFTAVAMALNVAGTFVLLPAMVFRWGGLAAPARGDRASRLGETIARSARWLAARRRAAAAMVVLALGAAATALPAVRLDTDFTHLRPSGGGAAQVEARIEKSFGSFAGDGVVLSRGATLEESLRAAEAVAARLQEYRRAGVVRSFSTAAAFLPSQEAARRRLALHRELPREEAAAAFRDAASRHGFSPEAFAGALADFARLRRPPSEREVPAALAPLVEQHLRTVPGGVVHATYLAPSPGVGLSALEARLRADLPGSPLAVTGRELIEGEFARLLERELGGFALGALCLNVIIVFVAERSLVRTAALLLPTAAALVAYLGLIGAFGLAIDPVNVIVVPLLIGTGVDHAVYLVAHARAAGSLERGMARGAPPLAAAALTTVAGLGALALSSYPALRGLGLAAALGFALTVASTLVLLPITWSGSRFFDPCR